MTIEIVKNPSNDKYIASIEWNDGAKNTRSCEAWTLEEAVSDIMDFIKRKQLL